MELAILGMVISILFLGICESFTKLNHTDQFIIFASTFVWVFIVVITVFVVLITDKRCKNKGTK